MQHSRLLRHHRENHHSDQNKNHIKRSRGSTYHTTLPPICGNDESTTRGHNRPGGAGRRRLRMRNSDVVSKNTSEQVPTRHRVRPAGTTALMYACQQGRDTHVHSLLQDKPRSVEARDRTMKSALHYCAENSSPASAELILAAAPELLDAKDDEGFTALHLAVIAGNVPLVRFLLQRRADLTAMDNESHSVVHWATVCGEVEALEALLEAGAVASSPDIHGGYPIHYAAQMCGTNSEMGNDVKAGMAVLRSLLGSGVDVNVTDKDGRQPVLWAASAGSADAVLALVNSGANVEAEDKDGLTALHCAASRGHTECLETLVTLCGAEVNVIDSNGCTALFYAVTLGHADCTQLLLSFGAEPNRQDRKGRTAAHCGAAKGQLETLRLLGGAGADLWTRNVRGDFPLHDAVQSGRRELVRWLLAQRPDAINVANNDGRSSLHIAAVNNNVEMCKVLLDTQSLVNPVMRGSKSQLMTPLDAALLRSNRGCAKYLQLHGGVPASKLTEEAAQIRGTQRSVNDSQIGGGSPATFELLTPRLDSLAGPLSIPPSPRNDEPSPVLVIQAPPSDQMTQTHEEMFREQATPEAGSASRVPKSRRSRTKKSASIAHATPTSSDSEDASETAPSGSADKRRRTRGTRRHSRGKRKEDATTKQAPLSDEAQSEHETPPTEELSSSPQKQQESEVVVAEVHQESKNEVVDDTNVIDNQTGTNETVDNTNIESNSSVNIIENNVNINDKVKINEKEDVDEENTEALPEVKENNENVKSETIEVSDNQDVINNVNEEEKEQEVIIENNVAEEANSEKTDSNNIDPESNQNESNLASDCKDNEIKVESNNEETKDRIPVPIVVINVEEAENENNEEEESQSMIVCDEAEKEQSKVKIKEESDENVEQVEGNLESEIKDEGSEKPSEETKDDQVESDSKKDEDKTEEEVKDTNEELITNYNFANNKVDPQKTKRMRRKTERNDSEKQTTSNSEKEDNHKEVADKNNSTKKSSVKSKSNIKNNKHKTQLKDTKMDKEVKNKAKKTSRSKSSEEENQSLKSSVSVEEPTLEHEEESSESSTRSKAADSGVMLNDSGFAPSHTDSPKLRQRGRKPAVPSKPTVKSSQCANVTTARARGAGSQERKLDLRNKNTLLDDDERKAREIIRQRQQQSVVSVTQAVQVSTRKYQLERRIFQELLELKRLQIRAGRSNEHVLVKRAVDEYRSAGLIVGLRQYDGPYNFRAFEHYLYDQLRLLQQSSDSKLIARLKPTDDIDSLSAALRRSMPGAQHHTAAFCTLGTHRCNHATDAYTSVPVAAYVSRPAPRSEGFLPRIDQSPPKSGRISTTGSGILPPRSARALQYVDPSRPVTLELSHGGERQVISLPTERLDRTKRYYVTFTIKPGDGANTTTQAAATENLHRHAKSL